MPRRKQQDGFDVLTSVFAAVPWWVPSLAAAVVWFGLPPAADAVVGQPAFDGVWPLAARIGGGLIGLAGVAGQFEKRRRRRLHQQATSLSALQTLSWREFEQLCAEAYRRAGYAVAETASGADGGVDLVLRMNRDTVFVQCKHFAARRVDVRAIRELYGVMAAEGATHGVVICSGDYTSTARKFAVGRRNMTLVDGPALLELLATGRASAPNAA